MRNQSIVLFALAATAIVVHGAAVAAGQRGGQAGLTPAQTTSAAVEVPRLVESLGLEPGMTVGDVGAGYGAWSMALAEHLGPSGRVYATDIGDAQLEALRGVTATRPTIVVVAGAERSTNLPAACCDAILVRDAYHHFTAPAEMAASLAAALKPGGRLAIIDFPPRGTTLPAGVPENRIGHGVPPEVVIEEITAAGLTSVSVTRDWSPESQPADLFLLVFRKP